MSDSNPATIEAMADVNCLLEVQDMVKVFPGSNKKTAHIKAVDCISFTLNKGETLGLVGESGSGKTTVARCILRAIDPDSGSILFRHHEKGLIDLGILPARALRSLRPTMQMIFQDPFSSLNPRMTVADIVGEPLVIHRMARGKALDNSVDEMLEKVGISTSQRSRYPHAFSGGQRQRIGIARALIMRPSLIIADEPVSALDVSVQAQVLNLLKDLQKEFGITYLFVAHNLDVVRHFCDRVAVMKSGRLVEVADKEILFREPRHEYTKTLLAAVPRLIGMGRGAWGVRLGA